MCEVLELSSVGCGAAGRLLSLAGSQLAFTRLSRHLILCALPLNADKLPILHRTYQHAPTTLPVAYKGCRSLIESLEWLRVQSLDAFALHVLLSDVN